MTAAVPVFTTYEPPEPPRKYTVSPASAFAFAVLREHAAVPLSAVTLWQFAHVADPVGLTQYVAASAEPDSVRQTQGVSIARMHAVVTLVDIFTCSSISLVGVEDNAIDREQNCKRISALTFTIDGPCIG
jgi:hypothetical protein